ncbi:MAG: hypothetical protein GY870_08060, partial [archaeon]|nr:hypothetical protein [archaeon]
INVETRIIPEKAGLFHFMAMLEYEFSKELFWMPSLKFKLKVLDSEDLSINLDEDKMIDEIYKKYGKVANEDQLSEENMNKSEGKNHIDTEYINQQRKDSDLLPDLD